MRLFFHLGQRSMSDMCGAVPSAKLFCPESLCAAVGRLMSGFSAVHAGTGSPWRSVFFSERVNHMATDVQAITVSLVCFSRTVSWSQI